MHKIRTRKKPDSLRIQKMTYAAIYLAIAMVLPFLTGQIRQIGQMLCPMHLPVLLCGFVCGWQWGLAVGAIAPVLRAVVFGMPQLYPTAVAMTFELAVYGAVSGLLYHFLPRKKWLVYPELVIAMIAGRIVLGCAHLIIAGIAHSEYTWAIFLAGAVTNAIPGIILQLILIPILVFTMEKTGLMLNEPAAPASKKKQAAQE